MYEMRDFVGIVLPNAKREIRMFIVSGDKHNH